MHTPQWWPQEYQNYRSVLNVTFISSDHRHKIKLKLPCPIYSSYNLSVLRISACLNHIVLIIIPIITQAFEHAYLYFRFLICLLLLGCLRNRISTCQILSFGMNLPRHSRTHIGIECWSRCWIRVWIGVLEAVKGSFRK